MLDSGAGTTDPDAQYLGRKKETDMAKETRGEKKRRRNLESQKAIAKRNGHWSATAREHRRSNINKKKADARQASYMDRVYGGDVTHIGDRALHELDALMAATSMAGTQVMVIQPARSHPPINVVR